MINEQDLTYVTRYLDTVFVSGTQLWVNASDEAGNCTSLNGIVISATPCSVELPFLVVISYHGELFLPRMQYGTISLDARLLVMYVVVAEKDLAIVQYVRQGEDLVLTGTFTPSAGSTQDDYLWRFNWQAIPTPSEDFLTNGSTITVANFAEHHAGSYELLICRGSVVAVASAFYVELAGNQIGK